jgi:hypothetical protein
MNTLERRINRLEGLLIRRRLYIAYKQQAEARAEERRRTAEEEHAAAQAESQARRAAEEAKRQAEEAARAAEPPRPVEPRAESSVEPRAMAPPPLPPPEPKPPPWTYDPPPEMQIRPVSWRRSEPYDDGSEDNYGQCIVDYDPLAQEDADYYDDD